VLTLRDQHPTWDARKRHAALTLGHDGMPSADTITAIWRRHGRLDATRSPPRTAPGGASSIRSTMTLWQMDFKGHVALKHGRCHSRP
jgi:hypothetical protein